MHNPALITVSWLAHKHGPRNDDYSYVFGSVSYCVCAIKVKMEFDLKCQEFVALMLLIAESRAAQCSTVLGMPGSLYCITRFL